MEIIKTIKGNWITRKFPRGDARITMFLMLLLLTGSIAYQNVFFHVEHLLAASNNAIVNQHEYWRLWTALFAHADFGHIGSNLLLFAPFSFYLTRNFSLWLFPFFGFFIGGLINLIVVMTLPLEAELVGVSGVVHWMGATWITLAFFIDRRDTLGYRILKATCISATLFIPTTFSPHISYLSHLLGYILGVISGAIYYTIFRKKFLKAEVIKYEIIDDDN